MPERKILEMIANFYKNCCCNHPLLSTPHQGGRGWKNLLCCFFSSSLVLVDSDPQHTAEPGCEHTSSSSCWCFSWEVAFLVCPHFLISTASSCLLEIIAI